MGAATAAGFAAAAWLLALVGRIAPVVAGAIAPPGDQGGSAGALDLSPGHGSGIGTLVQRPTDPVSVAFLALLWGLIGGLGAAFFWASRHNARWQLGAADTRPPQEVRGGRGHASRGEPVDRPVLGVVFGVLAEDLAVEGVELDQAPLGGRLVGRVEQDPPGRPAPHAPPGQLGRGVAHGEADGAGRAGQGGGLVEPQRPAAAKW